MHFSECTCEMHALLHSKSIWDGISFRSNLSVPCGKNNTMDSSLYIICSVPYDDRDWRVCNESALGMCGDSPRRNKLPSTALFDHKCFLRGANQISMSVGRYLVLWFLSMAQTVARIFFFFCGLLLFQTVKCCHRGLIELALCLCFSCHWTGFLKKSDYRYLISFLALVM